MQYTSAGIGGWLILNAFNAIAWGSILGISILYRRPVSLFMPALLGFGYLAWAHYSLDLAQDARRGISFLSRSMRGSRFLSEGARRICLIHY